MGDTSDGGEEMEETPRVENVGGDVAGVGGSHGAARYVAMVFGVRSEPIRNIRRSGARGQTMRGHAEQ